MADGALPAPPRRVAVLDFGQEAIEAALRAARPDLELVADPGGSVDDLAVIAFNPGAALSRFRGAAWIHCGGAGPDKLLSALDWTPALVTRTVGDLGRQMTEYVLAYWLADSQRMKARHEAQAARSWDPSTAPAAYLHDSTALIVGTGEIGQEIARALVALGCTCHGVSRSGRAVPPFASVSPLDEMDPAVAAASDLAVICLPATAGTRKAIGPAFLGQFRGTMLFNIGRGETVDETALLHALDAGQIRRAVLDVFPDEPLAPASPLWTAPGVTVTPHVSGGTKPKDTAAAFLAALSALERGEAPKRVVDIARGY